MERGKQSDSSLLRIGFYKYFQANLFCTTTADNDVRVLEPFSPMTPV